MKICQTLWTCHKDLLTDSFGWNSPQHHLMAWAYSCLKLKELYPDVEFYTDSHGAKILIDTLGLPYSNYHIEYDNLKYNPSLWALPKVLTYGKQQQPFIHIDGDVFVFEKFNNETVNGRLIAQNQEISTSYYKGAFEQIINRITYTPELFRENLFSKYPKAYNAGILGGCDMELISKYVWEAVNFVEQNYAVHSNANFNIIFEQLLFYSIAQASGVKVECYYDKIFNDNGYVLDLFGDFLSLPKLKYLHLIGPLKRNKFACDQLTKRLYSEYPDYFIRIVSLFKASYRNMSFFTGSTDFEVNRNKKIFLYERTRELIKRMFPDTEIKSNENTFSFVKARNNPILNEVLKYEKRVHYYLKKFKHLDKQQLLDIENKTVRSSTFFASDQEERVAYQLYLNPFIEIIETPIDVLHFDPYQYLGQEERQAKKTIACIPQSFFEGYREVELDQIAINIISLLYEEQEPTTYYELKQKMLALFSEAKNGEEAVESILISKLKYLVGNNLCYVQF